MRGKICDQGIQKGLSLLHARTKLSRPDRYKSAEFNFPMEIFFEFLVSDVRFFHGPIRTSEMKFRWFIFRMQVE